MEQEPMFVTPFIYAATMAAPIIFPSLFWKKKHAGMKTLFYNVSRESENPYIDEPTSISIYDPDTQHHFKVHDIYEDECYEELCKLLTVVAGANELVYLATYDCEMKSVRFKSIMEEYLENSGKQYRFLDIKKSFYLVRPLISKISYMEMKEYYKVPRLDCKPLEYCAIFDQIMQDFDVNIDNDVEKMNLIYNHINPFQKT